MRDRYNSPYERKNERFGGLENYEDEPPRNVTSCPNCGMNFESPDGVNKVVCENDECPVVKFDITKVNGDKND